MPFGGPGGGITASSFIGQLVSGPNTSPQREIHYVVLDGLVVLFNRNSSSMFVTTGPSAFDGVGMTGLPAEILPPFSVDGGMCTVNHPGLSPTSGACIFVRPGAPITLQFARLVQDSFSGDLRFQEAGWDTGSSWNLPSGWNASYALSV